MEVDTERKYRKQDKCKKKKRRKLNRNVYERKE